MPNTDPEKNRGYPRDYKRLKRCGSCQIPGQTLSPSADQAARFRVALQALGPFVLPEVMVVALKRDDGLAGGLVVEYYRGRQWVDAAPSERRVACKRGLQRELSKVARTGVEPVTFAFSDGP